jgi:DDE superfamily endonuclease
MLSFGIHPAAHALPPLQHGGQRMGCRIMINANTDPATVLSHIVDTVGSRFAHTLGYEIMHAHPLGSVLGLILTPAIGKVADQSIFLGIDRDDRLTALLKVLDAGIWDRLHGRRHRTPAHLAQLLLARLVRWCPERHFIFVGDSGDGTSETARLCRQRHRHLTVVSTFYGDAALYEPPPPRTRRTIGRPRVKGQKLPAPQEEVAHGTRRTRLAVAWYGGTSRAIEVVTGTGQWYRIGEDLVAVRWVYVHDCTGTHRDEYFFTTDLSLCPQQIVECYTQRWSIETTFQECREHLKLESTKCYGQQTVLRFTPCLFGLYTIIVLLYLQLPDLLRLPIMVSWRGKSTTTFADMLMCVRRAIWQQWYFQTPTAVEPFSKFPRSLQETILYALAPAA